MVQIKGEEQGQLFKEEHPDGGEEQLGEMDEQLKEELLEEMDEQLKEELLEEMDEQLKEELLEEPDRQLLEEDQLEEMDNHDTL